MWLVDSSRIIDWMRHGRSPTRKLQPFVMAGQLVTSGIVRVEVLRGVVKPTIKTELSGLFDAIPEVPLSPALWRRITDTAWRLDRQGTVLPLSDLIIGVSAIEANARMVTLDPHFASIPELTVAEDLPHSDWQD